jgi:adenine-specific DNA-methyltransferase
MRIGRYFSEANDVTLFHGDCVKLLRKIPDASVQLVITSPPYNVGKEYERDVTIEDYLKLQCATIEECVRITRPGGSICWQVGNHVNGHGQMIPLDILLHPLFAAYASTDELRLRNRIVWHFEHGLHCKNRFSGRHETILWYSKGDGYVFNLDAVRIPQKYPGKLAYKGNRRGEFSCNPLGKNPSDVWIIPNVKNNHIEKTSHPCQFPIEIPERLILALSHERDLVVDPFLGAGTVAVAAVLHGRRAAGAEIKPQYLKIARKRISDAIVGSLRRRPFAQPIYQPKPNTRLTTSPFMPAGAPGMLFNQRPINVHC